MINRQWLHFFLALAAMLLAVVLVRCLVINVYDVPGSGLEPNIHSGEKVVVNRWSYGLRTGGGFFSYNRWLRRDVDKMDILAYNDPTDTVNDISERPVFIGYCKYKAGDTVKINDRILVIPSRTNSINVTPDNILLLCNTYKVFEHRDAQIKDGMLFVDGEEMSCASFSNDYYWVSTGNSKNLYDSRYFGVIPEYLIVGKVVYSGEFGIFSLRKWKQFWHQHISPLFSGSTN